MRCFRCRPRNFERPQPAEVSETQEESRQGQYKAKTHDDVLDRNLRGAVGRREFLRWVGRAGQRSSQIGVMNAQFFTMSRSGGYHHAQRFRTRKRKNKNAILVHGSLRESLSIFAKHLDSCTWRRFSREVEPGFDTHLLLGQDSVFTFEPMRLDWARQTEQCQYRKDYCFGIADCRSQIAAFVRMTSGNAIRGMLAADR